MHIGAKGTPVDLRRLPSPDDLLILLTVARLGRFNAVAETLGTTHTTISRRILALDKQLGGRTLERSPHGWELTQLGASAVAAAEAIEETLGSLSGLISQDKHALSGLVRISTSDGFGAEFVAPALVRLQRQHPLLNVEMLSATRKVSQNRSGVDLEIVVGRTDVSNAQTDLPEQLLPPALRQPGVRRRARAARNARRRRAARLCVLR